MSQTTIHNYNSMSKTIIYNNNKLKIGAKSLFGQETIIYNNITIPAKGSFGGLTSVFVAIENDRYVQYDVVIGLRWHCLSFYTIVKRQGQILYSDK